MVSKSHIDRLGERLKTGEFSADDLRELDAYRQSFAGAYEVVFSAIRQELGLTPTGRPAKSSTAIVDKLRRETIRLSQIQDIAGCRIVVRANDQSEVVAFLLRRFPEAQAIDRREQPSHGYRAVHVVSLVDSRVVEIQVRSELQHWWAELSEKLSDVFGVDIKYGKGDLVAREQLALASSAIEVIEFRITSLTYNVLAMSSDLVDAYAQLGRVIAWAGNYVPLNPESRR